MSEPVDWGMKGLVSFNAGKTELDSFECSNKSSAIEIKQDESDDEKLSSKTLRMSSSPELD